MTMITFSNDAQRKNFQVEMAITALQLEVQTRPEDVQDPGNECLKKTLPGPS
jgi:hypothetical protein